jgi:hypothetical protein
MEHFLRHKFIGIQEKGPEALVVHGVLEDGLYAMEIRMEVDLAQKTLKGIEGRMKRYTTARCPLALKSLEGLKGIPLGPELEKTIKEKVGRAGCRHLASIFAECLRAIPRALNNRAH